MPAEDPAESAEARFRRFLDEGRFMIQRSRASGQHVFPPRMLEPATGSRDLEWVEASGEGTIYSYTVVSQRPPAENYNIALVTLAEGPRLMTRIIGNAEPAIGMRVRAVINRSDIAPVLEFSPV